MKKFTQAHVYYESHLHSGLAVIMGDTSKLQRYDYSRGGAVSRIIVFTAHLLHLLN